jgi:transposase InsO family protein
MDFITGLPPSGPTGATNYMVIIDWLTKSVILIRMDRIIVKDVVEAFLTHFYMYYGIPLAITSNYRPQFISAFWGRVYKRLLIQRQLLTAFHPQTDGTTEHAN